MTLDCDSIESSIESVVKILGINKELFIEIITHTDFEEMYESDYDIYCKTKESYNKDYIEFGEYIYDYLTQNYSTKVNPIDKICWFHLARTLDANGYNLGIYPLGKILDKLFDDLYSFVEEKISFEEWIKIKHGGVKGSGGWRYLMKTGDNIHHGCFAMLIKEIAFHSSEVGNHDYLNVPEIIEDLDAELRKKYHINLVLQFIAASKPIIVKFVSQPDGKDMLYIDPVLHYIYVKLNNKPLSMRCNTCFDARGRIIPKEDIISIEKMSI